jgi:dTDP-4-amino-4,6-dideoxygalactose transaminase
MGRAAGYAKGGLPVTDSVSGRLLRLPCYFELERWEQDRVVEAISSYFEGDRRVARVGQVAAGEQD